MKPTIKTKKPKKKPSTKSKPTKTVEVLKIKSGTATITAEKQPIVPDVPETFWERLCKEFSFWFR